MLRRSQYRHASRCSVHESGGRPNNRKSDERRVRAYFHVTRDRIHHWQPEENAVGIPSGAGNDIFCVLIRTHLVSTSPVSPGGTWNQQDVSCLLDAINEVVQERLYRLLGEDVIATLALMDGWNDIATRPGTLRLAQGTHSVYCKPYDVVALCLAGRLG